MFLTSLMAWTGGFATFTQVLLALPMVLDLLGAPSFLLLSLLFTLHHFLYSTLRLLLKNTPLAPLVALLSFLSPFISTLCITTTIYFYLHPSSSSSSSYTGGSGAFSILPSMKHLLVDVMPYYYATVLRWVSPLFTLLEGISTLLVIQVAGRVGKGWADEEEREEGVEWRGLLGLVAAALVYCAGLAGVIKEFPTGESSSFPAFLLGAALTAVVFLSLIGFTLKRTNVLETSLVFVYVVYSAWLSGVESKMEPRTFGSGWLTTPSSLPPSKPFPPTSSSASTSNWASLAAGSGPASTVHSILSRTMSIPGIWDSLSDIARTLPPHLLLSLIYRVAVLHLAARIVPVIRKYSMGWDDGMGSGEGDGDVSGAGRPGFWDGRSLGEEPANMRATTVVLAYRRAILIAVYTHLLLLDAGSQTWWRWINIALFLSVWSLELLLDAEDDNESVGRWKVE